MRVLPVVDRMSMLAVNREHVKLKLRLERLDSCPAQALTLAV